jgi:hypothetical protein
MRCPTVSPACEELLLNDLRQRTATRGSRKRVAYQFGIDESRISGYFHGTHIPEHVGWRILAQVRMEDLALADKIEAELLLPCKLKERQ